MKKRYILKTNGNRTDWPPEIPLVEGVDCFEFDVDEEKLKELGYEEWLISQRYYLIKVFKAKGPSEKSLKLALSRPIGVDREGIERAGMELIPVDK